MSGSFVLVGDAVAENSERTRGNEGGAKGARNPVRRELRSWKCGLERHGGHVARTCWAMNLVMRKSETSKTLPATGSGDR